MLVAPLKRADAVARAVAEVLRPPRRITPTEAAAGKLRNDRDVWDPNVTPYLIEPLDLLTSRAYQGIVFVGPARTGKTFGLAIGGMFYVVTVMPADMLAVYMSQDTARDFSRLELDRAIANTPEFAALLSPRARDDNTYDKFFRNGVALKIGWPAATQLRGKTVRYVWLMDYDGAETSDVDGRGSMWSQAFKRIETYMSRGTCVAESSPGRSYEDADWEPRTPHEAPPARGIASIYNAGTRARYYWRCLHCAEHFQAKPGLEPFAVPDFEELREAVQQHDLMMLAESFAKVVCPHCGGLHEPHDKPALNAIGRAGTLLGATWLHEGQRIVNGRVEEVPRRTNIASFWLGGCAAAYQSWTGLLHKYLSALSEYLRTGDETGLKESSHDDQGWPYLPLAIRFKRKASDFAGRKEASERGVVPGWVRFLTAQVDVQAKRFVVQVHGWGRGLESALVDRFEIFSSARKENDGRIAPLHPAAFVEDWRILRELVIERRYPVAGLEVELMAQLVLCDSGGEPGVTQKAYEFWREMRDAKLGQRFMLVKGVGNINAPRVQLAWPDARARKDRSAGRGDVPVWLLNVNVLKDAVNGDLAREQRGPGYIHVPDWVDPDYFAELAAEIRTAKGWERRGQMPNEAFDLHAYGRAACVILGAEAVDWDVPPAWASDPGERTDADPEPPPKKDGRWLDTRRKGSFW